MEDRVCKRCLVLKPIADFRKRTETAYSTMCKPCLAAIALEHYHTNRDKILASPERKVYQKEYEAKRSGTAKRRQQSRESYYRHREERLAKSRAQYQENRPPWRPREPFKEKCKALFAYAVKIGRIQKQPCSVCGALKAEGHHPDYFKPLEVIWLCRVHHAELRRKSSP